MINKRLIDANSLHPHKLYDVDEAGYSIAVQAVDLTEIEATPTFSAKDICYCKDCVKWNTIDCPMMNHYHDEIPEDPTDPKDFCSYGERKKNNEY